MELRDKIEIINRNLIKDSRGYFLKIMTGTEKGLPNYTGEVYLTMSIPKESKGGHYHLKANEWFTLIKGECSMILEDINTKDRLEMKLNANYPQTIYVPKEIAHIFINNAQEDFILLAYTDVLYEPEDTLIYSF